jgi:hypothetical protein
MYIYHDLVQPLLQPALHDRTGTAHLCEVVYHAAPWTSPCRARCSWFSHPALCMISVHDGSRRGCGSRPRPGHASCPKLSRPRSSPIDETCSTGTDSPTSGSIQCARAACAFRLPSRQDTLQYCALHSSSCGPEQALLEPRQHMMDMFSGRCAWCASAQLSSAVFPNGNTTCVRVPHGICAGPTLHPRCSCCASMLSFCGCVRAASSLQLLC